MLFAVLSKNLFERGIPLLRHVSDQLFACKPFGLNLHHDIKVSGTTLLVTLFVHHAKVMVTKSPQCVCETVRRKNLYSLR